MIPASSRARWVFVDSSAYLALLDRDDEHYQTATAILGRLIDGRYRLFTTNTVIIEAHALILSALGIDRATGFPRESEQSGVVLVRTRAADEAQAKELIYRYQDKRFSLTDTISFVVMERLGITRAFSFDRNFNQYGFRMLLPDAL